MYYFVCGNIFYRCLFLYIHGLIMINRLNKTLAICNCIPILGANL